MTGLIFQSTLPQGKWHGRWTQGHGERRFQSTLPQGKWLSMMVDEALDKIFQSTLPQGKWQGRFKETDIPETISIHTSTREVTALHHWFRLLFGISIHTSTREVTHWDCLYSPLRLRFQSTLPQGKWPACTKLRFRGIWFQSTLPQGKWPAFSQFERESTSISIHTSTREVTSRWDRPGTNGNISIHTSTREVTALWHLEKNYRKFQSTLPQGKWLAAVWILNGSVNFNPHFHKGSDHPGYNTSLPGRDFNPHFHKGSDSRQPALWTTCPYFNPHFHKGSDYPYWNDISKTYVFQSTLPQGKWLRPRQNWRGFWLFQSTLPQGKWRLFHSRNRFITNFNPHFHKGSDKRFFGMARVNVISIHTSTREVTHLSYKECVKIYISIHTSTREVTSVVCAEKLPLLHFNPHFHKGSDAP